MAWSYVIVPPLILVLLRVDDCADGAGLARLRRRYGGRLAIGFTVGRAVQGVQTA